MANSVKISVVVPIYNLKNYLPRCMKSLLMQNLKCFEIILVDDGSTDGSANLCDQYEKAYPDLVHCLHKKNGGLSSARNAGMRIAQSKYVIFPDPDDWVEPNYLSKLLELQEHYKVDMVCTGYYVEYDNFSKSEHIGQRLRLMSRFEAQKALLIPPCMSGFAWNKLYNLEIICENNLNFLNNVGTTEDLDFAFRYLQYCTKICFAPEFRTYHYYQRSGAATHSGFSRKKMESIHTYEKILSKVGDDSEIGVAAKEEICNIAVNLIPLYFASKEKDEAAYKQLKGYIKKYYLDYVKSNHYGRGRKIQAILARFTPVLYWKLKSIIAKE